MVQWKSDLTSPLSTWVSNLSKKKELMIVPILFKGVSERETVNDRS